MSSRLPPVSVIASGTPVASVSRWCFEPKRPRSTGDAPCGAPQKCADMTGVGDRARPVDLAGLVQTLEQLVVQALPLPGLLPLAQPPPARHARAIPELQRQVVPRDPGMQHVEDAVQRLSIIEPACDLGDGSGAEPQGSAAAPPPTAHRVFRRGHLDLHSRTHVSEVSILSGADLLSETGSNTRSCRFMRRERVSFCAIRRVRRSSTSGNHSTRAPKRYRW